MIGDLVSVLTMMAIPAAILFGIRCLIVRQNRAADSEDATEPASPPSDARMRAARTARLSP